MTGFLSMLALLTAPCHAETFSVDERMFAPRVSILTGAPDLLSLSAAFRPARAPFQVDAGAWIFAFSQGGYLRVGRACGLSDRRDESGRGRVIELAPLLGVRGGLAGDDGATSFFLVPDAVVSLDATWWRSEHLGLGLTLTLGGMITAGVDGLDTLLFPDVRLAWGISL